MCVANSLLPPTPQLQRNMNIASFFPPPGPGCVRVWYEQSPFSNRGGRTRWRSDNYIPGAGQVYKGDSRDSPRAHLEGKWKNGELWNRKCGNGSAETKVQKRKYKSGSTEVRKKLPCRHNPPHPTLSAVKMGKGGLFIPWCMHKQEHVLSAVVWSLLYTAAFSAARN